MSAMALRRILMIKCRERKWSSISRALWLSFVFSELSEHLAEPSFPGLSFHISFIFSIGFCRTLTKSSWQRNPVKQNTVFRWKAIRFNIRKSFYYCLFPVSKTSFVFSNFIKSTWEHEKYFQNTLKNTIFFSKGAFFPAAFWIWSSWISWEHDGNVTDD